LNLEGYCPTFRQPNAKSLTCPDFFATMEV
jgi:hypothetical protein